MGKLILLKIGNKVSTSYLHFSNHSEKMSSSPKHERYIIGADKRVIHSKEGSLGGFSRSQNEHICLSQNADFCKRIKKDADLIFA